MLNGDVTLELPGSKHLDPFPGFLGRFAVCKGRVWAIRLSRGGCGWMLCMDAVRGREMKDWSDGGMYFEEVRDI